MKHNWTYKKLGEVVKCYRGLTYSKADEVPVSSKMVLRSNNIDLDTHALNFDEIKCVREDLPIADDRKLKKDSIFICMSNGSMQHLGKVAYVDKDYDYAFGGFMGLIVPNPQEVFPKYVYYSLLAPNFLATILREGRGANINNLRFTDLENYSLPMPAKDEQQAIVRELDGINRLIDLQEEQLREYDRLAQSLFYTTFGDPATNPKEWEVKKLGDYFHIGSSKRVFQSEWKSKGVPFYRAREVVKLAKDGFVDNDLFIDEELYAEYASKYGVPAAGDILVTGVGTLGITYIVKENDRFYYKDGNIICLHKNTDIESLFIDFLFKTPYLRAQIENCSGATVGTYTIDRAKKTEIIVPPLSLQQTFAAQIEAIEQQKALVRKSLDETRTLLAARMQYYFE